MRGYQGQERERDGDVRAVTESCMYSLSQEQELDDVRSEMASVQNQLTAAYNEKQNVEEDGQALQHILIQKEVIG